MTLTSSSTSNFSANTTTFKFRPKRARSTALAVPLVVAAGAGKLTVLASLDISAAFDTVDTSILLHRLEYSFGITGSVKTWLNSYLSDRSQSVKVGNFDSQLTKCDCGVPQGSILGPIMF